MDAFASLLSVPSKFPKMVLRKASLSQANGWDLTPNISGSSGAAQKNR